MGNVGIRIGQLYREAPVIEMSEKLKKNASWGHRLSKIKVAKSQLKDKIGSKKQYQDCNKKFFHKTSLSLSRTCHEFSKYSVVS